MSIRHRIAAVAVAVAAAGTFLWAVATLWFHYPKLPTAYAHVNAFILIILWAIGPAVWFLIEWRFWKTACTCRDPDIFPETSCRATRIWTTSEYAAFPHWFASFP